MSIMLRYYKLWDGRMLIVIPFLKCIMSVNERGNHPVNNTKVTLYGQPLWLIFLFENIWRAYDKEGDRQTETERER